MIPQPRFTISAEHLLYKMILLHRVCEGRLEGYEKIVKQETDAIAGIYKKLDVWQQGEFHHFWCEFMKSSVDTSMESV